jgi:arsenate reductase
MTIIYGISNCDTVKKALKWLNNNNISYEFHDFKKQGLSDDLLHQFAAKSDWQALVNKRSTTFRNLAPSIKENLTNQAAFKAVMEQPTLLKRPVLIHNDQLHLGFKEAQYQDLFIQE